MNERTFHWVNKTASSSTLSRSEDLERTHLYRHVQRRVPNVRRPHSLPILPSYAIAYYEQAADQYVHKLEPVLPQSPGENKLMYCHRLLESFIDQNVGGMLNQSDYLDIQSFFWIMKLPSLLATGNPTVCSSIVALAAAGLGQASKNDRLIRGATAAYEEAIANLSSTCMVPDDAAFAACLSLVMYQYFAEKPDRQHLYLHIRGLAAILQNRGPSAFQDGLAHDLFTSCRSVLISSSMHSRQASFVAGDEWIAIPWQIKPKSSYEQMLDCLSIMPQLGQEFRLVHRYGDTDAANHQLQSLLTSLWSGVSRIWAWFLSVADIARPTSLVHTHLPCILDPAPLILTFPKSYQYRSLASSNMCRLFWAALVDIYNMLALTYETLAQHGVYDVSPDPAMRCCRACIVQNDQVTTGHNSQYFCIAGVTSSGFRPLPPFPPIGSTSIALGFACRSFARAAAEQVCMSLQYCISPQHGQVGRYLCIIPIKFAVWCFTVNQPSTRRQLEWARQVVGSLADSEVPFSAKLFCDRPYMED